MATMYGHEVTTFEADRFAKRIFTSASRFASTLAPGAFLVDVIPALMWVPSWFPGAGWKRESAKWAKEDYDLYMEMLEAARENKDRRPSFISEGLSGAYGVTDEELAYIGGTISQTPDTVSFYNPRVTHKES